jgi:chromate transport protein ChrA
MNLSRRSSKGPPFRHIQGFKAVLKGIDAAAIGLVGAACVGILWEAVINDSADAMILFGMALTLPVVWSLCAPFVVLAGGVLGTIWHANAIVWLGATTL